MIDNSLISKNRADNSNLPPTNKKFFDFNRNKAYWLCQISGWSIVTIINLIFIITLDYTLVNVSIILYLGLLGLSFTHLFRMYIRQNKWIDLPINKLIPRVITGIFTTSFLITLFYAIVGYYIDRPEEFHLSGIFAGLINISSMVFIWSLIYFIIHFFENSKKAEIEALIWEAAVKDFELKTLKSQINPHFMFNAMNSIRALIEINPEIAKSAITQLSNLLRYSLKIERDETVFLTEEIQNVKDYLSLEKIRYEERLRYDIEIDTRANNMPVPPMMIQTLVENGIKHGISKIIEGGVITINAEIINSKLRIVITNSGHIDLEEVKHSAGFGISNTRHRLNLLYGNEASFNINNKENKVVAEIIIPAGGTK